MLFCRGPLNDDKLDIQRPEKRDDPADPCPAEENIYDGNVNMVRMIALDGYPCGQKINPNQKQQYRQMNWRKEII